mgnify:CR=1 FL=1
MRTHLSRYALLVALLVMLLATETMAYTIGFNSLGGSNLSSFTSYTENGYTVSARAGDNWLVAKIFGNEIPAIVAGPIYSPLESQISVTYEHGGQFTFQGIDLTSNVAGGTSYTIEGFLSTSGIVPIFTETVVIHNINTFNTFETSLSDRLELVDRVTITGTPGHGTTSFNIDNIRAGLKVSDGGSGTGLCPSPPCTTEPNVPEPGSIVLLAAGLAGIEIWRRRRGEG